MASLSTSFNSSKLKLAHVNIRSCRNKEVEISLFLKENDIDIDIDIDIYLALSEGGCEIFGKRYLHCISMVYFIHIHIYVYI